MPCHPSFSFLGELTRECFNGMWKEIQGDCTAANGWFYTIIVLLCVIVIACLIFALFVCKRTHGDFAAMNEVYAAQFEGTFPARSAVAVKTLPKNALVEVEVIAVS